MRGLGLCKIIILRVCKCSEEGCYGNQPKKCKRPLQRLKVPRSLEITWSVETWNFTHSGLPRNSIDEIQR